MLIVGFVPLSTIRLLLEKVTRLLLYDKFASQSNVFALPEPVINFVDALLFIVVPVTVL